MLICNNTHSDIMICYLQDIYQMHTILHEWFCRSVQLN